MVNHPVLTGSSKVDALKAKRSSGVPIRERLILIFVNDCCGHLCIAPHKGTKQADADHSRSGQM